MVAKSSAALKSLGKAIMSRRKEMGLSRAQLAAEIGRSLGSVRKYECGEMDIPYTVLVQIFDVLKIEYNLDEIRRKPDNGESVGRKEVLSDTDAAFRTNF